MKQAVLVGTTDYTVLVKIRNDDGTPATALTEGSIDIAYARVETDNDVTTADVTPAALANLTAAHADWGFEEVSATDHPGLYRLDIADEVFASGAWSAVVTVTGTGLDPADLEFMIVGYNQFDGVRFGLTALPNAAADAAGGLIISDAGGLDADDLKADVTAILADTGTDGVAISSSTQGSIADAVWDEAASGHVAAGSFGQRNNIIRANTAQAGDGTHITLDASASATNDFYNNQQIFITAGTGAGQGRIISDYVGATKVAEVATWAVNPSSDSVFVIWPFGSIPGASAPTAGEVADAVWDEALSGHTTAGTAGEAVGGEILRSNTAQAGGASSITLDASASATNDLYNYNVVRIIGGTGAGQSRQISDYNGTSKVATVSIAWTTNPSSDSVFQIIALGVDAATVASIADGVWDEARAGHVAAGSFGEYVLADATRLSGDATAADNAEAFFDGTGYAGTNNVIPTVTTVNGLAANVITAAATAADFGTEIGTAVWATTTRELTHLDEDNTTIDINGVAVGSVAGNVGGNVTGSVGSVTGNIGGNVGGNVTGSVGSLAAQAKADVNAEVVDALATDTYAEPAQGTPAATATLAAKVNYLYKAWRNRSTQTSSQYSLYNDDATTIDHKAAVSDDATTFSKGEVATGP